MSGFKCLSVAVRYRGSWYVLAVLDSGIVMDIIATLREMMVLLIASLRLVIALVICTDMSLGFTVCCRCLRGDGISLLLAHWHSVLSTKKKFRLSLVNIHALLPSRVVISKPTGSVYLRMVHDVWYAFKGRSTKGVSRERKLIFRVSAFV